MEDIDEKESSAPSELSSDGEDSVSSDTSLSVGERDIYTDDDSNDDGDDDDDLKEVEAAAEVAAEEQDKADEASIIQEEKIFSRITDITERILSRHVQYNAINDMIADRRSFLVDGDSLLLNAVGQSGLDSAGGGQMLHCVYLCERLLQIFARVSGTFEIVFSKVWDRILKDNHSIRLARSVLKHHFRHNTKFFVHEIEAIWSVDFRQILKHLRPSFLLCDILPKECNSYFSEDNYRWVKVMSCANILYSIGQGLPCVDFRNITLEVSTIHAYFINVVPDISRLLQIISRKLVNITKDWNTLKLFIQIPQDLTSVRRIVYIASAAKYLTLNKDTDARMLVKVLLLKCALLDALPLKFRAFPQPYEVPKQVSHFITEIHKFMHLIMENGLTYDCCFSTVSDIWQGNLFLKLLVTLRNRVLEQKCGLGNVLGEIYVHLTATLSDLWGSTLEPFPITSEGLKWTHKIKFVQNRDSKPNTGAAALAQFDRLLPISCSLTKEFCGEEVLNNLARLQNRAAEMQLFISRNLAFEERHHWHSRKKLTDDFSRVFDDRKTFRNSKGGRYAEKKAQKHQARFARYMNIYGSNLEGRSIQRDVIVRGTKQNSNTASVVKSKNYQKKKPEKPKMADIIRKQNNERKRHQNEDSDKVMFKKSSAKIKSFLLQFKFDIALQELQLLRKNLKTEIFELETELLMAETLHKKLQFDYREKGAGSSHVLELYKELFLLLRDLLIGSESKYKLSDENKKQIAYYLTCLNMHDISSEWNLPYIQNYAKMTIIDIKMSWAEFQLKHLGPSLIRKNRGEIDDELGFAPDDWQKMLIDTVRKRQSAVVVAPTSSGKTTYASYYCMKSVLKEGHEGIVVYVSPTKALVNQVAATVYARFKNVTMPPGLSVYGIFTRDYRENALTCQILVTVPECLEILLLSPRTCSWVRRLRYIIFDEIHCLSGIAGGLSWESGLLLTRCPFLALSATIEQPEILQRWLQESMNFKKDRDMQNGCKRDDSHYVVSLITHNERHNDLKKYIYVHEQNSLVHVHPYACLTNKVIDTYSGIPSHLTLSAEETLSLFGALQATEQMHTNIEHLRPERFFRVNSQKLFITRSSVKEYEKELRELLSKWAHEFNDSFVSVVSRLAHGAQNLRNLPLKVVPIFQLPSLIETLEKNKMFPAIVFLFDRHLIHTFLRLLNRYYDAKTQGILRSSSDDSDGISTTAETKTRKGKTVTVRKRRTYSLGLLKGNASSLRSVGVVDSDDLKFIENRLIGIGHTKDDSFVKGLRNGIGIHHSGLNSKQRVTVEMMFRMKVLNVVFATSTLALGIHMPCKTVVVATDSSFLTPLNYHQMSGRAGRRGFDAEGNVVFWGVNESKIQNLLTGKLPILWGNFPMSISLVLRLLLLVSMCEVAVPENNADRGTVQKEAVSRALTFLNCNLIYQHFAELKQQMKHFFAFSTQLLMMQKLLDDNGRPQHLCSGIVTHLHYHEPGNLVFAYLLRSGVLHSMCVTEEDGKISKETQLNVVLLMAHLFTRKRLHPAMLNNKYCNSVVKLRELPADVVKVIEQYNSEVKFLFDHYFRCVAEECSRTMGEDRVLPISQLSIEPETSCMENTRENELPHLLQEMMVDYEPRVICSAFIALSGYSDSGLYSEKDVVSNLRHQVFTDKKIVPIFEVDQSLNSYAWDFYNHGIRKAILKENLIRHGDDFTYLKDFLLVLLAVYTSLQDFDDADENRAVIRTFGIISENFRKKFNKAYKIVED